MKVQKRKILFSSVCLLIISAIAIVFCVSIYKFQYVDLYFKEVDGENLYCILYEDTEYYSWYDIRNNYIQTSDIIDVDSLYVPTPYTLAYRTSSEQKQKHYLLQSRNKKDGLTSYLFACRAYPITENTTDMIYVDNPLPFGSHGTMYYRSSFVFPTFETAPIEAVILDLDKTIYRIEDKQKIQNIVEAFKTGEDFSSMLIGELSAGESCSVFFKFQDSPLSEQIGVLEIVEGRGIFHSVRELYPLSKQLG